jgi:hypothetical protein
MRVLLLTGLVTLLAAPEVSWADDSPAVQARVLSLDDGLPKYLRPEVKGFEKQFKKQSCRVPWNTVGPVKYATRERKTGRVPGWEIGKGKGTVFVGHQNRQCEFSTLRSGKRIPAMVRGLSRHKADSRYESALAKAIRQGPKQYATEIKRHASVHEAIPTWTWISSGGLIGLGAIKQLPLNTWPPENLNPAGLSMMAAGTALIPAGIVAQRMNKRAMDKKATLALLSIRRRQGKRSRSAAEKLIDSCFDKNLKRYTSAAPGAWNSARSSCEKLASLIRPGAWEYGKLGDKTPAELAVRAANQVRALGGVESRGSKVSQCLAKNPTTKNKYTESCSGTDGNQAIPKGLQMANSCRSLLDELSALGSSGRKMYPIKNLRRTVEAQEKAVATARKTGRKWREEKDAACAQDNKKAIAKDRYCKAKYGRGKSTVTATFECTTTGMVKTRAMTYQGLIADMAHIVTKLDRDQDWAGTMLKVDGCTLLPTPALPTNCPAWHRLR